RSAEAFLFLRRRRRRLLDAQHPCVDVGVAYTTLRRQAVAAQDTFEREAGAFGDPSAALVAAVRAHLDPARAELVERDAVQRADGFSDKPLPGTTAPAPVADLEAAHVPQDAMQPAAADVAPLAAVCRALEHREHQIFAQPETGLRTPAYEFRFVERG